MMLKHTEYVFNNFGMKFFLFLQYHRDKIAY